MFYDLVLPKVIFSPNFLFLSLFPPLISFPISKPFEGGMGGGLNYLQGCYILQKKVSNLFCGKVVFFSGQVWVVHKVFKLRAIDKRLRLFLSHLLSKFYALPSSYS